MSQEGQRNAEVQKLVAEAREAPDARRAATETYPVIGEGASTVQQQQMAAAAVFQQATFSTGS